LIRETGNAEMHLLYGRLRMGKKQYPEAAEEFRRAADLQPQSAEGYTNLASALYLLGNIEATVGALAKVSELQKDTAGTYFLRAICLDKLDLRKPALENYQRFLAADAGKNPDQEFQARQRSKLLTREIQKGIAGRK
jgi:tetratricopeptide (TPR) repeat protein